MGDDSATVPYLGVKKWTRTPPKKIKLTSHESRNFLLMFQSLGLLDEVDLILENDDVFELHDLDSGKMFRCLRLGARLISSNQQQGSVHNGSTVQHSGHQDVVSGTVNEGYMPDQLHP